MAGIPTPDGGAFRSEVNPGPIAGKLRLGIRARNGRSYAAGQYHENALRVLKPLYLDVSGQVVYTMVNPGGAYLGADTYEIDVNVGENASLLLTTQSATKVYKTPQGPARQHQRIRLGPGSVLESLPDQVIVYREGRYIQETVVDMDPASTLLMGEIVTPGWSPTGVSFAYEELRMRTEIRAELDGRMRPLAVDNLRIKPGEGTDVAGIGFMEGHSHTGQLLIADRRVPDVLPEIAELVEASPTQSGITQAGAVRSDGLACCAIRSLADRTGDIRALHLSIANLVRDRWRGQGLIDLRKYS